MNTASSLQRNALALSISFICASPVLAQDSPSTPVTQLPPIVVTGNPLRSEQLAVPASVLSGDALLLRRGSSLGETLNGLPGVSASYFGPNASRPVIRGLDGDRVRVLSNGAASLDASSLSFDHAVPIDPLVIERIEVLRGPAALMYGGSAIGGVVNALDNRFPKDRLNGVSGSAEARLGGAARERGGAALVEAGNGRFAVHADVFGRNTDDQRVPRFVPVEDGTALPEATRIHNSAARTRGGALGASTFFDGGYLGIAADTYDSRYGITAEPDVLIRMKRDHLALAGEVGDLAGPIRRVRAQLGDTRYRHEEVEGSGEIGTTFRVDGTELRLEAEQVPLGPLRGVFGMQWEDQEFSALGEEAFVPATRTRRHALFAMEEMDWAGGRLGAGLRIEQARVASAGDADATAPQFGPAAERRFTLRSASLSNLAKLSPQWSLSGAFSVTERAPTSFELFANGAHAATAAYERGDPSLQPERGTQLDVALQWKAADSELRLGAYAARFDRFISLEASGRSIDLPGEGGGIESLPEYVFRPVRARLWGAEVEGRHRLRAGAWAFVLSGKLDLARATNADTGQPLPRIAPLRTTLALEAQRDLWTARAEIDHAARQSRVPAGDTATAGYTLANLSLRRRFRAGAADGLWFIRADNIGNTLAYSASTVQTLRALSPLPARALKTGVRLDF